MPQFTLKAVVTRQITDDITMKVRAANLQEAEDAVREALEAFPESHTRPEVRYSYIDHREYHEPHLVSLEPVGV